MRRFDLDTCEEIILTITRNKTRSLLTAFGVFWGIFMLVTLMGGTKGVQDLMAKQFVGFATNSGFMGTNQTSKAYKGFQQGRFWELTNTDVERVRRSVPEIEVVTPNITKWGIEMVYNENKTSGTLKGLYPIYSKIEEPQISMGRYINDMDILNRRKVCVLGSRIFESLFPDKSNPCGKYIEVSGIYYQVIGVNMAAGNMSVQGQAETSIIIPFSTMQQNYNFGDKIQMLSFTVKKGYSVSEIQKKVESVIKRAHNVHPDDKQAVISVNAEAMFGMMDNLFSGIEVLGWMVGLGTLLAGAIGVSNIMMVTVKERTTEIGIRRAIGARPNDILSQILTESMVLTIIAGMSGISFAVFLLKFTAQQPAWCIQRRPNRFQPAVYRGTQQNGAVAGGRGGDAGDILVKERRNVGKHMMVARAAAVPAFPKRCRASVYPFRNTGECFLEYHLRADVAQSGRAERIHNKLAAENAEIKFLPARFQQMHPLRRNVLHHIICVRVVVHKGMMLVRTRHSPYLQTALRPRHAAYPVLQTGEKDLIPVRFHKGAIARGIVVTEHGKSHVRRNMILHKGVIAKRPYAFLARDRRTKSIPRPSVPRQSCIFARLRERPIPIQQ